MFEPKSMAESIVAKKLPESHESDDGGMSEMHMIAQDMMDGFHSKDVGMLASALEALKHQIGVEDESQDSEMMGQDEQE